MKNKLIYFIISIFVLGSYPNAKAQELVTIQANQQLDTATKFMQGFLHGNPASSDSVSTAKLKPAFWRIGIYWFNGANYDEAKRFNPKISLVLNDLYKLVNNIYADTLSKPWINNWYSWDSLVTALVNNSVTFNKPVDYWDVWAEPDNWWTGTSDQFFEMYRRTDSIIRSVLPNAKIVGPDLASFNLPIILAFIDFLNIRNVHLNAISWHEFFYPENITVNVQQMRDSLAVRPWAGNPEIHIPEYAGFTASHLIPGWNVGWIYYLEKAKVNWASHGCWNESDGTIFWSDCAFGLNGLFMSDNVTPQPNYWVHRAYAELDTIRLVTTNSQTRTVSLAGKNDVTQEMKIIVGRYDNPNLGSHNASANVEIKIRNYPYGTNSTQPLVIQRIPSNNVPYSIPLLAPLTTFSGTVTFTGDSARIFINGFVDGDAYIIYINPASGSVFAAIEQLDKLDVKIYPNPASSILHIQLSNTSNSIVHINIVNILGQELISKQIQSGENSIDVSTLPNGIYFVRATTGKQTTYNQKIIITK